MPRYEYQFPSGPSGRTLGVLIQLDIKNVIYGTNTPYEQNSAFPVPTVVTQGLPPMNVPVPGPPGPIGKTGQRGSLWFVGTADPPAGGFGSGAPALLDNDMYLNTTTGDVFQWRSAAPTSSKWQLVLRKQP